MFNKQDPHYMAVKEFYGNRTAVRSRVPYINHINEGLYVLDSIRATTWAQQGYCLHPFFQNDNDLKRSFNTWILDPSCGFIVNRQAIILAMEYRRIANAYLASRTIKYLDEIELSPLNEVQHMLIADKVQNRKDFELYHQETHPRSSELTGYFKNWLRRLGVDEDWYQWIKPQLISLNPSPPLNGRNVPLG